jgi:hypothetical protein
MPQLKIDAALVNQVRLIQQRSPSNNPQLPYALQVILQTDSPTVRVSFAFDCTGPVGAMSYFVAGQTVTSYPDLVETVGDGKSTATLKFSSPAMTPAAPLVVTLYRKIETRVLGLRTGPT